MFSGPSLIKPYLKGVTGSSSTIKVQQIRTGFQNPAAQYTQSLGKTISTASHSSPPVSFQPSDHSTPATPYKDPGFGVDYLLPGDKRDQSNGHSSPSRRPSCKNTSPSEPSSPLLQDPLTDDFGDRFHGYTGRGGEFRAELPSGDRGVSRMFFCSSIFSSPNADEDSTFHLPGDAQGLGSPTRNTSRAFPHFPFGPKTNTSSRGGSTGELIPRPPRTIRTFQ